jgi:hypothetical protein
MPIKVFYISDIYTKDGAAVELDDALNNGYAVIANSGAHIVLHKPSKPVLTFPKLIAQLLDCKCVRLIHADNAASVKLIDKDGDSIGTDTAFHCVGKGMTDKTTFDVFAVIAWMQNYDDNPVNWHAIC